jgi:hypothetical protein
MAKASLRKSWRLAEEPGLAHLNNEEIDREIAEVRTARQSRKPE